MIKTVHTDKAPIPGGHFSQGKIFGNLLFTAGQIGHTVDKKLINDTLEAEVGQIMKNLSEVALAAGTNLSNTLKTTIFITDMQQFSKINSAYAAFFPDDPPARSTVEISKLAVGARVEIEAIIAIL
ncbi:MAG: RidA family protein [Candidatus Kariarchaeaceae archaeon]|jgi:2-iminobutanoate/2-iminopropanoate deaminase